jgi:cytochrome c oxidase subunit I
MPDTSAAPAVVHGPPTTFLSKHVFSLDHKVIGLQYYTLALFAVVIGMVLSWLMRIHLGWTNAAIPGLQALSPNGAPGGVMTPEYYLQLMTMHATIMVFFVLTTAPFAAFGNYFLPIQVGAEDMPFPHFNMMSFWTTFTAFLILVTAFFVPDGPPLAGWTSYAPLSAIGKDAGPGQGTGQVIWAAALGVFCIGQLLGSLNFISTVLDMRTKGMTLSRLPVTCWAWFITSCMGLTAFAVLMPATILLILDHVAGTSFFVPSGLVLNDQLVPHSGGSTLLWQHLFWFFGHPEVYIAIVPGMGIVTHVLTTNMRRPMLSMKAILYSMWALAFLSYMVYGHHMFVSGMNPFSSLVFSFPTLMITIPSTVVVLIWIGSLYGSKLRINTASLFALGFISMFVSGGVSGFFLAQPSIDIMLHATYFVVGHFHMVMGVAAMFGIFSGTYFWFPKMTGHMMNETIGKIHFWLTFIGTYCIFMPFHYLGWAGNVRRYAAFTDDFLKPLIPVHQFITIAALFTGAVQLLFLYNLIYSRFRGPAAPANPWEGTSLEWIMPSPPPWNNFGGKDPVVYHDADQYGVRTASGADYIMQNSPEQALATSEGD